MNAKISFLVPPFPDNDSVDTEESNEIFENQGTLEEIFFTGPQVPLAALLHPEPEHHAWMCLELVHLHATRDHIVLMDPRLHRVSEVEEQDLRASVQEIIAEKFGTQGHFFAQRWILPAGAMSELNTHTPSQAMGLNMDVWMPKDRLQTGLAKKWRKLQNEIQMVWHDHPVNEARLLRGELPINSVWVYGIGSLAAVQPHPYLNEVTHIFSAHPLAQTLDTRSQGLHADFQIPATGEHYLIVAQDMPSATWQTLWEKSIKALQEKKIEHIICIHRQAGAWVKHVLHWHDVQSGLFKQLFGRSNQSHPHAQWSTYVKKISWSPL